VIKQNRSHLHCQITGESLNYALKTKTNHRVIQTRSEHHKLSIDPPFAGFIYSR